VNLKAETLFLKNGKIYQGSIVSKVRSAIFFKDKKDGKIKRFRDRDVLRILYTNLYMGRQYIRLTNGKVVNAYKVGEDNEYITFRKDLSKPKEFKIHRSKILFMARNTPTELKGKADFHYVDISWQPPIGKILEYRIYVAEKNKNFDKKNYAISRNPSLRLGNLKSSRDYKIIVTAVGSDNKETLPSNMIFLTTKNKRPNKVPTIYYVMAERYKGEDGKKHIRAQIKWKHASDSDGSISKYTLFYRREKEQKYTARKIILKDGDMEKEPSSLIKKLKEDEKFFIIIESFDNRNLSSGKSSVYSFSTKNKRPHPPKISLKTIKKGGKKKKTYIYKLIWTKAKDEDGKVVQYQILENRGGNFKVVTKTSSHSYTFSSKTEKKVSDYSVRSVDNRGAISKDSLPNLMGWHISLETAFVLPLGDTFSVFHPGVMALVSVEHYGWPIWGLGIGLQTGYVHLFGKHPKYISYQMIPLLGQVKYTFDMENWTLGAFFAAGASFNMITYSDLSFIDHGGGIFTVFTLPDGLVFAIQPVIRTGIFVSYKFSETFKMKAGIAYMAVIEEGGAVHLLTASLIFDFKFF